MAVSTKTSSSFGEYICDKGYMFPDQNKITKISCLRNSVWKPSVETLTCERKLVL